MATTERVTVTLSADLVEGIDRLERNRSRFIAEAVSHELTRRRREGLLTSVRNAHPETADLADTSVEDWTGDLPDDEGLVDMARGTAVRSGRRAGLGGGARVSLDRGIVVRVEFDPTIGHEHQ